MQGEAKMFSRTLFLISLILFQVACSSDGDSLSDADSFTGGGDSDLVINVDNFPDSGITPTTDSDLDSSSDSVPDIDMGSGVGDITVNPKRINDVLINPGMGFANFHFGWWCNLPPITFTAAECAERVRKHWPENYPDAGTSYFRWQWKAIEPERGKIDFDMIDMAIQSSNALGETFSFRIMLLEEGTHGVPEWLTKAPYNIKGEMLTSRDTSAKTFWPDYRDPTFQAEHKRMVEALADRYNDHPGVDHVDIGSVGCWGEWNAACIEGGTNVIDVLSPKNENDKKEIVAGLNTLIDHYLDSFTVTPVVMLAVGLGPIGVDLETDVFIHAMKGGAGWRMDCWGDWGIWGEDGWNHHKDYMPQLIEHATNAYPDFKDTWKHAPIQLEVCKTMPFWHDLGWTANAPDGKVYKTFEWAGEQHASFLNTKFKPVHNDYVDAVNDLLVNKNGYRFVIDSFNHDSVVKAGKDTTFTSTWSNIGVAPSYIKRALTFRLKSNTKAVTFKSTQDIRTWLPGSLQVVEMITIPADLKPGSYKVEAAILDRAGTNPDTPPLAPIFLGIEGRTSDGWYTLSTVTVE